MTARFALFLLLLSTPAFGQTLKVQTKNPLHPDKPAESHTIAVTTNADGLPELYSLALDTQTCFDEVCKPLQLTLNWDPFGRYAGFDFDPDNPLTKMKHEPFGPRDYEKLDELLSDNASLLGQHPLNFFVLDEPPKGEGVDALSGATPKAVKNSVVGGAAYSSWLLWQWAHGDIVPQLRTETARLSTPAFLRDCLASEDPGQIQFALQTLLDAKSSSEKYPAECLKVLETADRLNCTMALRYLQKISTDANELSLSLVPLFGKNIGSSRLIYRYFDTLTDAKPVVWDKLAEQLSDVPDYQQLPLLNLLEKHAKNQDAVRRQVTPLQESENFFVARRAREFLGKQGE